MNTVVIVAIVFGSFVTIAGLVCGTVLVLVRMRHNGIGRRNRHSGSEEAKMIQEIYQGLGRMEERIEALETILMEGKHNNGERHD